MAPYDGKQGPSTTKNKIGKGVIMKAVVKTVEPADREARFDHIRPHYLEALTLVERLHRRLLDVIKDEFDRRSVRIKLTDKGQEVRDTVDALYQKHVRTVEQVGGINADEFSVLNKALHRLERFWTDQILYRL